MSQGDVLMARKRANAERRLSGARSDGSDGQPPRQPSHETSPPPPPPPPPEPAKDSTVEPLPPIPKGSRLSDPQALLESQFVLNPPPLPVPPTNWDESLFESGAVPTGSFFRMWRRQVAEREQRSPGAKPPSPPAKPKKGNLPLGMDKYQPNLDEISRMVVIESLIKQQEEEEARKAYYAHLRKVQLGKFDAQRRHRVLLEVKSGLPVSQSELEAYCINPDDVRVPREATRNHREATKEAIQRKHREEDKERMCRLLHHRTYCLEQLRERTQARCTMEGTLGTHFSKAKTQMLKKTGTIGPHDEPNPLALTATCPQPLDLHRSEKHRREDRRKEEEETGAIGTMMEQLNEFDEKLRGETKKPRQRGLPFSLNAPHKHIPGHRPAVICESNT
eukprot:Sspe_Gene.20364::Locus_7465_Transcript_1_1_Confidence_1.000_Length_1508::g.20364::m.20364